MSLFNTVYEKYWVKEKKSVQKKQWHTRFPNHTPITIQWKLLKTLMKFLRLTEIQKIMQKN